MNIHTDEKNILNVIKYAPIIFIFILSLVITQILIYQNNDEFKKNIKIVEKSFLESNKLRVKEEIERVYTEIKNEKEKAEELLKEKIKNRVYEAHAIATNIYTEASKYKNDSTYYSEENIFQTIKHALSGMIYNKGRGYIFISDSKGINLLQPMNKNLENKPGYVLNNKEIDDFTDKLIDTIDKKSEDYSTYPWFKFGNLDKKYQKMSFYKYFEPLNLAIGSGEYIKDFENELKNELLNKISNIRFGENGYIFIYDLKGTCLSHFKKELIGLNSIGLKDTNGNFIIKDILNFAEINKQGFMSYRSKIKANAKEKSREKISYIKLFDDWNWVIGTGFYFDSLEDQINKQKEQLIKFNEKATRDIILIALLFTFLTLLLSFYITKQLEKRFLNYTLKIEKQTKTLLEAQRVARIGDWSYDIVSNKYYLSDEILKIFGMTESKDSEFIEYFKTILHEDDVKRVLKTFFNSIETGEDYFSIYRIYDLNNEIRWISSKAVVDKKEKVLNGVSQDITELKKLELEKEEKEEILYQQNKMVAMGEMISNIAHQWRQPLSAISTASTGAKVQKHMNTLSGEELDNILTSINDSAQYLSQTIEDFRNFLNPSNNKMNEFYIKELIHKTLKLLKAQFIAKEIEIIENIEDFSLLSIENEFIQVLINILNNARDILILKENQARLIFINTYKKENSLYVEILDNGGGVDKDIKDRIFEPYFTTKHKSQGTGIGLYMSLDIIKNHLNGTLFVRNEKFIYNNIEYTGAKFIIKIPLL